MSNKTKKKSIKIKFKLKQGTSEINNINKALNSINNQ